MTRPNRWVGLDGDQGIAPGPHPLVRKALRSGAFFIRHGIAAGATVLVPCLLWTVAYFGALLWAMITDEGVGSPVAYPAWLFGIFVFMILAVVAVLFPSVAAAEWFARKMKWPILSQIPLSVLALLLIVSIYSLIFRVVGGGIDQWTHVQAGVNSFIACLLPLGVYWWVAQSGPLLLALWRRLRMEAKK